MKLTVIGGGGLRTPMFAEGAAHRAKKMGLAELCLADIDPARLEATAYLSRQTIRRTGAKLKLTATTNMDRALRGADFVVTTIRVGGERGRVIDERVPISLGVVGQETTGPGGMAMALRSIPVILDYARRIEKIAPQAWLLNFTNPAGLVVQALRDEGFGRSVGICDSAENLKKYAALHLGVPRAQVRTRVFGLNHLSYGESIRVSGRDVTRRLLADDGYLARFFGLFDREWIRALGLFPNEYLYYFAHTDHAVQEMRTARQTRGEEVAALSGRFFREWQALPRPLSPERALRLHEEMLGARTESYMNYAWERTGATRPHADRALEIEGYAGVALEIMGAVATKRPAQIALNVENRLPDGKPAIAGLAASDVVEVSCTIERGRIVPDAFPRVPEAALTLVQSVKRYEILTCRALRSRRAADAVDALAAHPLVPDRDTAQDIFAGYLRAHGKDLGPWR